jgi:hypothetical protein
VFDGSVRRDHQGTSIQGTQPTAIESERRALTPKQLDFNALFVENFDRWLINVERYPASVCHRCPLPSGAACCRPSENRKLVRLDGVIFS